MKSARLVALSMFTVIALAAVYVAPFFAVQGNFPPAVLPAFSFSIKKSASPNIVVNGNTVTYTIRVQNTGAQRNDITVTDEMGRTNGVIKGTDGGKLRLISGSVTTTGINEVYVQGTIDSTAGMKLSNVGSGVTVLITYKAIVDDMGLDPNGFTSVPNHAWLDNGSVSTAGLRVLGATVLDKKQACSAPAFGDFPDPSSEAELRCYENNLVDRGVISGPVPQAKEVAPALALETTRCTNSAVRDFTDVTEKTSYQCAISLMYDLGIMKGYANQTFRPKNAITRAEFTESVIIAAKLKPASLTSKAKPFRDVSSSTAQGNAILTASQAGIVAGYPDGTFRPNALIHRDEAAKMILRAFGLKTSETLIVRFSDVKPTDALAAYVATAAELGAVEGMNGKFFPKSNVSRVEVAKMISKVLGFAAGDNTVNAS